MCVGWFPVLWTACAETSRSACVDIVRKIYAGTLKGEGFYAVNPFCTSVNPAADTHLNQVVMLTTVQENLHFQDYRHFGKSGLESAGKKISLKIMT